MLVSVHQRYGSSFFFFLSFFYVIIYCKRVEVVDDGWWWRPIGRGSRCNRLLYTHIHRHNKLHITRYHADFFSSSSFPPSFLFLIKRRRCCGMQMGNAIPADPSSLSLSLSNLPFCERFCDPAAKMARCNQTDRPLIIPSQFLLPKRWSLINFLKPQENTCNRFIKATNFETGFFYFGGCKE